MIGRGTGLWTQTRADHNQVAHFSRKLLSSARILTTHGGAEPIPGATHLAPGHNLGRKLRRRRARAAAHIDLSERASMA